MRKEFVGRSYLRRLPVYLLLDCSSSMDGAPIIALRHGVERICRDLRKDPLALQTVHISVITFSSVANQYAMLPLDQFTPPDLSASGTTAMGAAFDLLTESLQKDLIPNIQGRSRGDWCPLVFLITDGYPTDSNGYPTDDYKETLQKLKDAQSVYNPTIVALGCGSEADQNMLHEVTDEVYLMHVITSQALNSYFRWVTNTIKGVTHALGGSDDESSTTIPMRIPDITKSSRKII